MAFAFCACGGFAQNLIQNGDFTQVKHTGLYPECGTNGGKASLFTEESTWNKCGKLEVDKIMKDKNGNETANAYVWIGGDSSKGGGFAECRRGAEYSRRGEAGRKYRSISDGSRECGEDRRYIHLYALGSGCSRSGCSYSH